MPFANIVLLIGFHLLDAGAAPDLAAIVTHEEIWKEVQRSLRENISPEDATPDVLKRVCYLSFFFHSLDESKSPIISDWRIRPDLTLMTAFPSLRSLRLYFECGAIDVDMSLPPSVRELWLFGGGSKKMLSSTRGVKLEIVVATGIGLDDTADLVQCQTLRWLDLHDNAVKDISALAALKNLKCLDISGNPIRKDALDRFSQARPDVRIIFGTAKELNRDEIARFCGLYSFWRSRSNPQFMKKWNEPMEEYLEQCPSRRGLGFEEGMPNLDEQIHYAMPWFRSCQDKFFLADFAAPLVSFLVTKAKEARDKQNRGIETALITANPYLQAFAELSGLTLPVERSYAGQAFISWLTAHRVELGPSLLLDDLLDEWVTISRR